MQGALAACTAVWAMEAAFLLLVCLGQRLRLLLMRFFTRAAPATKEWAMSLPRNTEEATAQFNYQLNLIGLQTEQWMTDTWAKYLRQRRKWMTGSGGNGAPAKKAPPRNGGGKNAKRGGGDGDGAAGLGSMGASIGAWWDERVAATNQAWVGFQIQRAKATKPGGKGGGARGGGARGGADPDGRETPPRQKLKDKEKVRQGGLKLKGKFSGERARTDAAKSAEEQAQGGNKGHWWSGGWERHFAPKEKASHETTVDDAAVQETQPETPDQ